jgi:ubiquinone/menaquinone biosynthesis C-methylase UbiE
MAEPPTVPNHHAHYPGFSGVGGVIAALSMTFGRDNDARLAAELADLRRGDVVVDVGCGPGAAARYASSRGATVTGIDPAAVMLRVARLVTRPGAVKFVRGGAEAMPVSSASATVVWTIASVHHWSDVEAGIREALRVLTPGGRFVAIERARTPGAEGLASHGWTEAQAEAFAELARQQGFVAVRVTSGRGRGPALAVVAARP